MAGLNYDITKAKNKIKGDIGEIGAIDFLKKKKFKIIQTNYKTKFGEIDIIAQDGKVIVFIEVKRRSTLAFGRPIEAVDWRKQQKIRKVAEFYLMLKNQSYSDVRFDVMEIIDTQINYVENAF